MIRKDPAGEAALEALKSIVGVSVDIGSDKQRTGSLSSNEIKEAADMSSDKQDSNDVQIYRDETRLPEAGSAEAELQRRADSEATKKGSSAGANLTAGGKLPEKGSAEAEAHRLVAAEASRRRENASAGAHKAAAGDGDGNISFLLTALLLPLLIVGGIYGYASYKDRHSDTAAQPVPAKADRLAASTVPTATTPTPVSPTGTIGAIASQDGTQTQGAADQKRITGMSGMGYPQLQAIANEKAAAGKMANSGMSGMAEATGVSGMSGAAATSSNNSAAAPGTTEVAKTATHTPAAADGKATAPEAKAAAHHAPWDYEGANGPAAWGTLDPAYQTCKIGMQQSPIDIPLTKGQPGPRFEYNYQPTAGDVVNNGHTILVKPTDGQRLLVDGNAYELENVHFHTPSENMIGGHSFPMEIHLVHKNATGQRAVVAVMVEQGGLNEVLERLPAPNPGAAPLALDRNPLDLTKLLPEDRGYFTFAGSLTTPPCNESVGWIVLSQPIRVPRASIDKFKQVLKANNRPVQPLNGRIIYSSH